MVIRSIDPPVSCAPEETRARLAALHDASLSGIELDWPTGVVTVTFRGASGTWTLRCVAVRLLDVPRTQTWGPSVSVNEAVWLPTSGGGELHLQLQSGDLIRVVCGGCTVWMPQAEEKR